jgi:RNA polymerase sigma-70 factor (ECF subfamily)
MQPVLLKDLYERYGFIIYRRCLTILHSEDEAKDAMQAVFVKFADEYHRIREKNAAVAWVFRTATNYCFNVLRDKKKFVEPDCLESIPDGDDIEDRLDARNIIRLAFAGNPDKVRDAVYFTYVEKLTQEEITKITGQSPATIRRNLARFKQKIAHLKQRLGV